MNKEKKLVFDYSFDCKLYKLWLSLNYNYGLYYILDLKSEKIKKIFSKRDFNIDLLNDYLKQYKIKAIKDKDFYIL